VPRLTSVIPVASILTTAATYDAVRLVVDRATTAAPGFALTDAIAPAVAALCQQLDGLPLAIELAASRAARSFAPAELVEHLDQRFGLLSAGARTAPPRQRTLRGTIDWSYELLDDDERALFDRLGVFPADFDFEAAHACAGRTVRAMRLWSRSRQGLWTSLLCPRPAAGRAATACSSRSGRMPGNGSRPPAPSWTPGSSTRPTTSLWPCTRPNSIGRRAFETAHAEGEHISVTQALRLASTPTC
jgi:hypothetical protein